MKPPWLPESLLMTAESPGSFLTPLRSKENSMGKQEHAWFCLITNQINLMSSDGLGPRHFWGINKDLYSWPTATLLQQGGLQSRSWIFTHICFSMGEKVKITEQRNLGKKLSFPPWNIKYAPFCRSQNCDTRLSSHHFCWVQLPHFNGDNLGVQDLCILYLFYSLKCFYNKICKSKPTDSLGLELHALYKILSTANIHFIFQNKFKATCICGEKNNDCQYWVSIWKDRDNEKCFI